MAKATTIVFRYICIFIIYLVSHSACIKAAAESSCSFPPGSIACKVWNHTNMDCSWRELDCIPQLHHKASLESLDLSNNDLNVLPDGAFSGFIKLQILNLSYNSLGALPDNAFSELPNLLSLNLADSLNSVSDRTFNGLHKLKTLYLSYSHYVLIYGSPFKYLYSLQTLSLRIHRTQTVTPATFVGLNHTLQVLHIIVENITTDSTFVQLSSLRHLDLQIFYCSHVNETLFSGLEKLSHLRLSLIEYMYRRECIIDISPLISLTHLSYREDSSDNDVIDIYIQTLNSSNSSLQALELIFEYSFRFNSSTFEPLLKWKESLQELRIYSEQGEYNLIEGSPFKWFSRLTLLCMRGDDTTRVSTISWDSAEKTFEGLAYLTEVHLNYFDIDNMIADNALCAFIVYNYSLEVLDLAYNDIYISNNMWDAISYIPTLQRIDFSNNVLSDIYFEEFCSGKSNLKILNINHIGKIAIELYSNITCPKLVSLNASNNEVMIHVYSNRLKIHVPHLEELYLSGITCRNFSKSASAIKVLTIFDVPQLKTLDLSSNQISAIDKEDAWRLSNVIYLDLRNNQLTSLSTLDCLYNVEVLLVGINQITTVPRSLLSSYPLQTLDLHDNVFVCDCNIEGLQKWVLTDDVVYLWNNFSNHNSYKCAAPEVNRRFSITEVDLSYCEVPLLMYISVGVTSVLVTIIAAILVVRYRWHIQYRIFLLFNRRVYQNYLVNNDDADDDFEDEDGPPRYDAYVIYHNQDEDWVDEQLVANIEEDHEEPFRLCLKNRDIRAGRLIFNELSLHIRRSRKTLVILTPRFVDDNWCYFQLNMAHHRVLEENHNVLIFIMLEEIPNNRLTLLLRQLFCRAQCLKWPNDQRGQNLFWRCLREELKRPVPRDERVIQYRQYNI